MQHRVSNIQAMFVSVENDFYSGATHDRDNADVLLAGAQSCRLHFLDILIASGRTKSSLPELLNKLLELPVCKSF